MEKRKPLTTRQRQILEYIRSFLQEKGYSPSVREIGAAIGLSSTSTVHSYLHKLRAWGYLQQDGQHKRTLRLLDERKLIVTDPQTQVPGILPGDTLLIALTSPTSEDLAAVKQNGRIIVMPAASIPKDGEILGKVLRLERDYTKGKR